MNSAERGKEDCEPTSSWEIGVYVGPYVVVDSYILLFSLAGNCSYSLYSVDYRVVSRVAHANGAINKSTKLMREASYKQVAKVEGEENERKKEEIDLTLACATPKQADAAQKDTREIKI